MRHLMYLVLAVAASTPAFGQVVINEIHTGDFDALEILNLGSSPVSIAGWRVEHGGVNPSLNWVAGTYVFPGGASIPGNGLVVVRENTSNPPVAAGAQVFQFSGNIGWATTGGGQTRGGSCILLDAASQPVDAVRWLGAVPPNSFGSTFIGTYNPNSQSFTRIDLTDDDDASDWGDEILTLGELGLAQQSFFNSLEVSLTSTGAGDLVWTVTSQNPPAPGGEIFNLVSVQDFTPDGSGPFFGIGFDAIPLLLQPAAPTNPFHTWLDGSGQWSIAIPGGLPLGLHVETVSIMVTPAGVSRVSNTAALTF